MLQSRYYHFISRFRTAHIMPGHTRSRSLRHSCVTEVEGLIQGQLKTVSKNNRLYELHMRTKTPHGKVCKRKDLSHTIYR
ncbi:hypothetical protein CEXT_552141 [Caerostris extrusa]|uniref:Uncharacterized protein n=1 Tax=Caerostris extrusa TaxID=172846 RepID=A0AAV4X5F0_CAEEX|nr:hypothetical protein CEXT_552141 [Caerostris extrusa]